MKHAVFVGTVLLIGIAALVAGGFTPQSRWSSTPEASGLAGPLSAPFANGREPPEILSEVYPRGRWRLANMDELAHVVLWASHILVRHENVVMGRLSFERSHWKSAPQAPARSRGSAFNMARAIEQRVRARPETFDEVARTMSEDVATRERGGSLGGIAAIYLRPWPEVLDAFAALQEGEISRVVETEFGFHIFLRRPVPTERRVSGARIIVGHADTSWFGPSSLDRRVATRSRLEGLALAQSIYEEARAHPDEFARLVQQHSEHRDFVRDGDFGEWSTREPTPFAAAVEALQGLEVGDIAPPMDSLFGYQIIQRTPSRPRREYAMRSLNVPFDPELPDSDTASRASARRRAEAVLADVRADASRFAAYQEQYCCAAVEQWVEGRGSAVAERVLVDLRPGEVAANLIEEDRHHIIVQRVALAAVPVRRASFELPRPERPDLKYAVSRLQGLSQLSAVREQAAAVLVLDRQAAEKLTWLHDSERLQKESASVPSWSIYEDVQRQTLELLGREQYERYSKLLDQHFEDYMLGR